MKILVATVPFDGHFNPLTSVAKYLQHRGHDVRWYASPSYEHKLAELEIPYYGYVRAKEVNQENMNEVYPERLKLKGSVQRLKFDIRYLFLQNMQPSFEDMKDIYTQQFAFDLILCDMTVVAAQLVKEKLQVPVLAVGVTPLIASSVDVAPNGLGMLPPRNFLGRLKVWLLQYLLDNLVYKESTLLYQKTMAENGVQVKKQTIFNATIQAASLYLQSGVPGFEYKRSDLGSNIRFVGPLLPYKKKKDVVPFADQSKLKQFEKVILISQGTADNKDPNKLIIPALEALKDTSYLLIVTTGYRNTQELRNKYNQKNIIIENYIDFDYIMDYTDLFITNGGYGSVMLSFSHAIPVLAAGVHEGKNEINARVEYFKTGINMRTEKPAPAKIRAHVEKLLTDTTYRSNAEKLRAEFESYNPNELIEKYMISVTSNMELKQHAVGETVS